MKPPGGVTEVRSVTFDMTLMLLLEHGLRMGQKAKLSLCAMYSRVDVGNRRKIERKESHEEEIRETRL